jgi:hypothetical protein
MPDSNPSQNSLLGDDIRYIVSIALLVIILVNFGLGLTFSGIIEHGGIKVQFADYIHFTEFYLGTFLLSCTLTVAMSVFAIPRMYGYSIHYAVPVFMVIIGSFLIGLPFSVPADVFKHANYNSPGLLDSWLSHAPYYGTASLFTGTVVGVTGGLALIAITHHHRIPNPSLHPPRPWIAWVTTLSLLFIGVAFVFFSNAGAGAAQLVLSEPRIKVGNKYSAAAIGFRPGEKVRFSWTGPSTGEMSVPAADSHGTASPGEVFERDPPGHYTITVTGLSSGRTAAAALDVITGTDTTQLVLSKPMVTIGDTYYATACGFSPTENLRLSWTGPTRGVNNNFPAANPAGTSWQQVYERDPPGHYTITVTGIVSGRTAAAELDVVPGVGAAGLVLSTPQVTFGDHYFATTWGFTPGENLQFSYTGPESGQTGVYAVGSNGSMWTEFITNLSPGEYTIIVTGLTSGRTVSATVQVQSGT